MRTAISRDPLAQLPIKPQQIEKIDKAIAKKQTRVAGRLTKIYTNWAVSRAAGEVLRKLEGALPHPIEFTRNEFGRGCLLAFCNGNYYFLLRLFAAGHRYCRKNALKDGFIDCKTGEILDGKSYPGLILPLELGREFHEQEYFTHGAIQSAKLVVKRIPDKSSDPRLQSDPEKVQFDAANFEFYVHAAFEFKPVPTETTTFLGIDRGAAKLGALP